MFIVLSSLAFVGASISYLNDLFTILFIAGLAFIAVGYIIESGTVKRNAALMTGSIFIGIYSYIEGTMIFFWLNVFFALFSLFHVYKLSSKKKKN
jgi:Ca2+/Na+ antiporter